MTPTYESATHRLECSHCLGNMRKTYYMRCHELKELPNGRLKLLVFGERHWKGKENVQRVRYVDGWRVHRQP